MMRIPLWFVALGVIIGVVVVVAAGMLLVQPPLPLIMDATISPERITPNADGVDDITEISYTLARNASVSLTFTAEDGTTFAFRTNENRMAGDYNVLFSGVVEGYLLPDETLDNEVLRRLMPDGVYTWRLVAVEENGATAEKSGTLEIADGDAPLPLIDNFTISPPVFTPNQDGITDRVQINLVLAKDAELEVYLRNQNNVQIFIPQRLEETEPGRAGRHWFNYAGGIDENAEPPADGVYDVIAEAQDAVGQRVRTSSQLTIQEGGKPLAQIVPQPSGADVIFTTRAGDAYDDDALVDIPREPDDVHVHAITMPLGDLLVFRLTVENYGKTPIRTTGPEPGTIYTQDQRWASLGWYESSGAWRVGIDCENAVADYPWRWAIGSDDSLELRTDEVTGEVFRYLPADSRSVVWGAVRMNELIEARNPQQCWAGLIHEDVRVTVQNSRVGPREVELVEPVE